MTKTTDVVEVVARVIEAGIIAQHPSRDLARAALTALAENVSEEMVEAGARAIYASAGRSPSGQPTWDEEDREMHDWIRGHARAALIAALQVVKGE